MICPNCKSNRLAWQSDFTYEDCMYEGEGTVRFYECDAYGTTVEVCIPDINPYWKINERNTDNE